MTLRSLGLAAVLLSCGVALAAQPTKRPTDEVRGKELYERHCLACHGTRGAGDGPATTALVAPVPDLMGKVKADPATVDVVELGRGAMPSFQPSFDAADAKRVLMYMAKLDRMPDEPASADDPAPDEEEPPADDAQEAPGEGPE
ncbi:MAG: cytochrome c [Alphaproteobacteria bacterium]|nr:cytochrome c [Alphaproteobacteria bacterium]MCB9695725.1 cytochrome c [Alphaproteobacteria bacterium]